MKEIFISYSSQDLVQAETLRNVLENNGLSCWMAPRDIPGGSNYTKEIPIAIRNCKVFVLILSDSAQNSHWVLKELDSAVNCGKVILPFMLEDCALNDEFNFLLTGAQRYSAYQKKAEAMETLIARIRALLDASPAQQNTPAEPVAKKTVVDRFCDAKCPACGGDELQELKGKIKCETVKEHAFKLFIPAMSAVSAILGFLLAFIVVPFEKFELSLIFVLVGLIAGAFWGAAICRNKVKRSRLRSGFDAKCYRCNRCQKVFSYKVSLNK